MKDHRDNTFWDRLVIAREEQWREIGGENLFLGISTNGRWTNFLRTFLQESFPLRAALQGFGFLLWKPFLSQDDLEKIKSLETDAKVKDRKLSDSRSKRKTAQDSYVAAVKDRDLEKEARVAAEEDRDLEKEARVAAEEEARKLRAKLSKFEAGDNSDDTETPP